MPMYKKCDIILPVCDQFEFTRGFIESLKINTDTPYRLIVINNGNDSQTLDYLENVDRDNTIETVVVHNEKNIGWVKAINMGLDLSNAPYVCFQNNDTIVTKGWLRKMIEILELRPEFGMINPVWEGRPEDVSIDDYNTALEKNTDAENRFIETDWCRGFSIVIKRDVIDKIGKVDEIYGLAYYDDVDYSVTALNAGFLCLRATNTYVYHHRNVTANEVLRGSRWNDLHEKNKRVYYKKWGRPLKLSLMIDLPRKRGSGRFDRVKGLIYTLARKQHRVHLWSSDRGYEKSIRHTNIIIRTAPAPLVYLYFCADLLFNALKGHDKRYNSVYMITVSGYKIKIAKKIYAGVSGFNFSDIESFESKVIDHVDRVKEMTKERVNVDV